MQFKRAYCNTAVRFSTVAALIASLIGVPPAQAATTTAQFNVQITIVGGCAIVSATDMNFGSTATLSAPRLAQSTVTVQCTLASVFNIGMDKGLGAGATIPNRLMTSAAGDTVTYSLYRDPTTVTPWGDQVGTNTLASVGTGLNVPYIVYGRVPIQTTPPVGVYNDTITVTVTF